jgi:tRNA (guanine26-N2/guanine27-N2)-dimethyltransferase
MRAETPPLDIVWSALKNAGYNVSSTHCCAGAFKTDAPLTVVWDMMKAWVKEHPVKKERLEAMDTPAARILAIPAT